MKKILFVSLLFLAIVTKSKADDSNSTLFAIDEQQISSELNELTTLENYLTTHPDLSLEELKNSSKNLNISVNNSMMMGYGDPPLGIPSFLWGCGFGVAGVAIVYFVSDDRDETKKALWGCVTSTVVATVAYFVFFAKVMTDAAKASTY